MEIYKPLTICWDATRGIPTFEIGQEYYHIFEPKHNKFVLKYPIPKIIVQECIDQLNTRPEPEQTMAGLNKAVNKRLSQLKYPNGAGSFVYKQRNG